MRRPARLRRSGYVAALGFTLVELVVVVLILGILAAIVAPQLLGTSKTAVDNGLRHTVSIVRDAIDRYSADNAGKLPGSDGQQATFKTEIAPYLHGRRFPVCPIGPAKNSAIHMMTGGGLAAAIAATKATHSWLYNYGSGDFYINCDEFSWDEVTTYDEF
jgi:general secretion pathway protein G